MIHFLGKWWFGPLSGIMARLGFKDMFLWAKWVFSVRVKIMFYGACALVFISCILFEFYTFLSSGIWSLLTCGTIFGTVDFGAKIQDEEEEAEPEDAAPPGC